MPSFDRTAEGLDRKWHRQRGDDMQQKATGQIRTLAIECRKMPDFQHNLVFHLHQHSCKQKLAYFRVCTGAGTMLENA